MYRNVNSSLLLKVPRDLGKGVVAPDISHVQGVHLSVSALHIYIRSWMLEVPAGPGSGTRHIACTGNSFVSVHSLYISSWVLQVPVWPVGSRQ